MGISVKSPTSLTVELPYPPTANMLWRRVGNKTLLSAQGRTYRSDVAARLFPCKRLSGVLRVEIDVYPPDRRKRDLDNTLKASLDAMAKGGAYFDDNQIAELSLIRCEVVRGGKIVVRITTL